MRRSRAERVYRPDSAANLRSMHRPISLLVALGALLAACRADEEPESLPPVVLIVVDTLRADHLGCYGYELDTSPVLDRLAEESALFEANSTQCNSTFPSITSIMTGLYPRTHRNYIPVPVDGTMELNSEYASLAERLRDAGYYTMAAVSHPLWVEEEVDTAVRRGWDAFSVIPTEIPPKQRTPLAHAAYTNERAFALLDDWVEAETDAPPFLWVHYFDPHTPYAPPEGFRNRFLAHHMELIGESEHTEALAGVEPDARRQWARTADPSRAEAIVGASGNALYDEEILFCDSEIGRLLERLDELGLRDDALIVFMADHGENLAGEPGRGRLAYTHERLFEGVTGTPLVFRVPGVTSGTRVASLSQNIDVLPTLLELLDLPVDPPVEGRSLVPLLRDASRAVHDEVYVESSDHVERAVKTPDWKLVDAGSGADELYRWRTDREERRNLIDEVEAGVLDELEHSLREFRPTDVLHVRFTPDDAGPYEAALELSTRRARLDLVSVDGRVLALDDPSTLTWSGTVGAAPVELEVVPSSRRADLAWEVRGVGATYVGRAPLERTTAMPAYVAGDGPLPEAPRLQVRHDRVRGLIELAVDPETASAEIEIRIVGEAAGARLSVEKNEGFEAPELVRGGLSGQGVVYRLTAGGDARALLSIQPRDAELGVLVLLDGQWPDPARVVWNDAAVDANAVGFLFPHPEDGRITTALLGGPPSDPAPRSASIWLESRVGEISIRTEGLDEETLEELRALGYVK